MNTIRAYEPGTNEHKRLEMAAAIMNIKSPRGYHYHVGDCYFDYGQDWMWTTILCDGSGGFGGYQALCPRDHEAIIMGNNIEAAVDMVFNDKYCPDRIR